VEVRKVGQLCGWSRQLTYIIRIKQLLV